VLPPSTTQTVLAQLTRDVDSDKGQAQDDEQERRKKQEENLNKGDGKPEDVNNLKDLPECRP